MSKHRHYDMIVAKAANMELVVFLKCGDEWFFNDTSESFNFLSHAEYFLCLPQYKEACLHWLDGGDIQYKHISDDEREIFHDYTYEKVWDRELVFMDSNFEIRIKPKKVKRWVGYNSDDKQTTNVTYSSSAECELALGDKGLLYQNHPWQFIEI